MIERQCTPRLARFCFAALLTATVALQFPCRTQAMLFWDADGTAAGNNTATGAGLGGSGAWESASNWFNGASDVPWTAGSDAVFSGTAGVVALGAPLSAASLAFKSDGYRVTGSMLTMEPPSNFQVDAGVTATIASTVAGSATMRKTGAGTLFLANSSNTNTADTTAGGWRIDGGTLRISGDGSLGAPLPDSARNTVTDIQLNQSTIQFAAPTEIDINRRTKVNTNGSVNLGNAVIDTNGHAVSWFGSIQGGPGSLVVTNSGPIPGILILGTDKKASINPFGSALPAGTVNLTVQNGAIVQTSGQVTPTGGELGSETGVGGAVLAIKLDNGQIRSESGGYSFRRNLILGSGGGSLDTGAWDQTFTGAVTGPGALAKFGYGTLIIDNTPAAGWAGGTNIHDGTLQLGRGGSNGLLPGTLANPSSVVIDPAGTLKFARGSDKSFFDIISGGGNVVVENANNAVVRLVSNNTYTGLTTIASGRLMIGQGNQGQPGSIVSNVWNNSELIFNRVENLIYAGSIAGSGIVTKQATGKLTLTAASTYSGATNVNAGTLIAANSTGSATGSGPVNVAPGATIGGGGSIAGSVALNSGAHLAPGISIGSVTFGSLNLADDSILDYELGSPALSDRTIVNSADGLRLLGGIVNITPRAGFEAGRYPLLDYTTSFTGSTDNLTIGSAPAGFIYTFVNNPGMTSIDLIVAVPEPTTFLGALAMVALLLGRRGLSSRACSQKGRRVSGRVPR
jgi:autotransporter-associated beta strand protein